MGGVAKEGVALCAHGEGHKDGGKARRTSFHATRTIFSFPFFRETERTRPPQLCFSLLLFCTAPLTALLTMAQRAAHVSHAWHDISIGEEAPDVFNAVIEIPRGSKVKYELDKVRFFFFVAFFAW
jgi:hypothetical protein